VNSNSPSAVVNGAVSNRRSIAASIAESCSGVPASHDHHEVAVFRGRLGRLDQIEGSGLSGIGRRAHRFITAGGGREREPEVDRPRPSDPGQGLSSPSGV
jgi:hypothetical protein